MKQTGPFSRVNPFSNVKRKPVWKPGKVRAPDRRLPRTVKSGHRQNPPRPKSRICHWLPFPKKLGNPKLVWNPLTCSPVCAPLSIQRVEDAEQILQAKLMLGGYGLDSKLEWNLLVRIWWQSGLELHRHCDSVNEMGCLRRITLTARTREYFYYAPEFRCSVWTCVAAVTDTEMFILFKIGHNRTRAAQWMWSQKPRQVWMGKRLIMIQ